MEKMEISQKKWGGGYKCSIVCPLLLGGLSLLSFCMTKFLSKCTGSISEILTLFNEQVKSMEVLLITAWLGISGSYLQWLKRIERKLNGGVIGISILFSFFTSLHASMPNVNAVANPNSILFLLHMSGYFIFYYIVITYLYDYLFEFSGKINQEVLSFSRKKMFITSFICLFLLWFPYIIMCAPGNMMWDTGLSIEHSLGLRQVNNNPFFQNYIYGLVYHFGTLIGNISISVFLYNFLQLILFNAVISYGIVILKGHHVPSILLIGIIILYGLFPVFPIYAFCMGKDSNFALCLLMFSILIFELVTNKVRFLSDKRNIILLFFISILLSLLRNQAYLIAVICLFVCSFVKDKKSFRKLLWGMSFIVLISNLTIPKLLHIPQSDLSENLSIPLQQTAYYVNRYRDEITESEKAVIDRVIPYEALDLYNPGISDPIKDKFDNLADKDAICSYIKVWWKHFLTHPDAYLKASFYGNYGYYFPTANRNDLKGHTFVGYEVDPAIFNKTELEDNTNPGIKIVNMIDSYVTDTPILGVFQKIGIYTWIMAVTVLFVLLQKKYKWLLCICPSLFVFIGSCCSPVNGYFRYAFPMIVCIPIVCTMVLFALKDEI